MCRSRDVGEEGKREGRCAEVAREARRAAAVVGACQLGQAGVVEPKREPWE